MRVLFINHKDSIGGAAVAAYRLAGGLKKYHQVEYLFLVAEKTSSDSRVVPVLSSRSETIDRTKRYIVFLIDRIMNKLGLQYRYFPFVSRSILKRAHRFKPDIISLHNTHGGYFKTSLIRKLSRLAPVVWTLHDMWSFTANAAHTFGDESWKVMRGGKGEKQVYPHIGINTGKWLLRHKRRIYQNADLYPVAPSLWLQRLALQSPVFGGMDIAHIYHGIDLDFFRPLDKQACRRLLGIECTAPVLLFSCSEDLFENPWKGGDLMIRILKELDSSLDEPVQLLLMGKGRLRFEKPLKKILTRYTGFHGDDHMVRLLINTSDVFIHPTRADTLPLVLIEAIACGLPCVSFDIGGCGEIVQNDVSGRLTEAFDVKAFVQAVLKLLENRKGLSDLSRSARKLAENRFPLKMMAKRYHELFELVRRTH